MAQQPPALPPAVANALRRTRAFLDRRLDGILARPLGRRLDPFLDIGVVRRINSLLLLIPVIVAFVLGLLSSQYGHIDQAPGIFPVMSIISGLNPFAGILSAVAYGIGDLLQKFVHDDVYYGVVKTSGDYWAARGGYALAYSSLVVFGVLPGVLARAGRLVAIRVASQQAGAKANGAQLSRQASFVAGAIGGVVGGAAGAFAAATAFRGLVAPAFLWRPNPDHSCFRLAQTNIGAATGSSMGAGGAAGAAGVTVVPPPAQPVPPAESPPIEQPPAGDERGKNLDPCADASDRVDRARGNARAAHLSLQEFRRIRNMLEMEWEHTRESSYLSGVVDVGFLAGSVWAKPGAAGVRALLGDAWGTRAGTRLIESELFAAGVKAFGKETMRDIFKGLTEQEIKYLDLALKPGGVGKIGDVPVPDGWLKKFLQQKLEESLIRRTMNDAMQQGLRATGEGIGKYEAMRKLVQDTYAKPLADFFGNFMSVMSMSAGAFSGAKKLAALRENMRFIDDQIFEVEQLFEDATSEWDIAKAALQHCRELHPVGGG